MNMCNGIVRNDYIFRGVFPSDIGEVNDFSQQNFIVGGNGDLVPTALNIFLSHHQLSHNSSPFHCDFDVRTSRQIGVL